MARRKKEEIEDDLAGTVEGQAQEFFEREKAAYEQRTGETVNYVPPSPVTRTPIEEETAEAVTLNEDQPAEEGEN